MSARPRTNRSNGKKITRLNRSSKSSPRLLNVLKHNKQIQSLYSSSKFEQKYKIRGAKKSLVVALSEIAKNILNKAIPLTSSQRRRLAPHAERLRTLVSPNTQLREKKQVLQTGGFLGFLLKPLLSLGKNILGPLLGG